MHFLLLGIGILIGLYGLYRFFLNASVKQVIALFTVGGFVVVCIALFFLAVTGRLPAALGLLAAIWPFVMAYWYKKKGKRPDLGPEPTHDNKPMTRSEAFEVLGIDESASPKEIKDAYNKLMKKVHPDQEGSKWMAAKLNQAKDILLK